MALEYKIVATADLHGGGLEDLDVQGCDLLLLAGDICPDGVWNAVANRREWGGYGSKLEWLEKGFFGWCSKHEDLEIFLTLGNRDKFIMEKPVDEIDWPWNVTCLIDKMYEYDGIKIYGTPWVAIKSDRIAMGLAGEGVYEVTPAELKEKFSKIPQDVDILLSHATPAGTDAEIDLGKDIDGNDVRYGSEELSEAIRRVKPKLVVCGHVHAVSHRVAHLEEEVGAKIVNASRAVLGDRKGMEKVAEPRRIEATVYGEGDMSFSISEEPQTHHFFPIFTEYGDPCDPFDGCPFEKDTFDAMFWELEAWALNPETVNYDEIDRVGSKLLKEKKCDKAIVNADWPDWKKILAAYMESVGAERDLREDKWYYEELPWAQYDKGPHWPLHFRFYQGEEESPYERRDPRHWFWVFEKDASRMMLDVEQFCMRAIFGRHGSFEEIRDYDDIDAPLMDKALLVWGFYHHGKWDPYSVWDIPWKDYFRLSPKPKTVHIACKFKTKGE